MRKISSVFHENNGIPGSRMICSILKHEQIQLSRNTVMRYMQELQIRSIARRKKKKIKRGEESILFPNILSRKFQPERRNQIWCTDFTNLDYAGGTIRYNCTIIDLYDRSVVAFEQSNLLNADLAIRTLNKALLKHPGTKGLILHSDQGCQFTSRAFAQYCKDEHIQQSMSKAGNPYDNSPMERYFNTLKNEFAYHHRFQNAQQLDEGVRNYVDLWYNSVRPHAHNAGLPPLLKE